MSIYSGRHSEDICADDTPRDATGIKLEIQELFPETRGAELNGTSKFNRELAVVDEQSDAKYCVCKNPFQNKDIICGDYCVNTGC